MTHQDFLIKAITDYSDKFDNPDLKVFVVWSVKVCNNSKAIIADNITNYLCEATMNGEKNEIYYDFYRKTQKEVVKI